MIGDIRDSIARRGPEVLEAIHVLMAIAPGPVPTTEEDLQAEGRRGLERWCSVYQTLNKHLPMTERNAAVIFLHSFVQRHPELARSFLETTSDIHPVLAAVVAEQSKVQP